MKNTIKINSKEWCSIIFKDKNKNYGAFALRKESSDRHLWAIGITLLLFIILVAGTTFASMVKSKADASSFGIDPDQERIISKIDMSQDEIIQKLVENISEPPKLPQANTIVYTPPIIGDDNEVDETIETHTVEEVIDSRATISTIDFNEGVDDLTAPTADIENRITETENTTFVYVEKMPEYPGGEQKMYQDISKVLQYPTVAQESGKQGRVVIRFIVRKDGSIDMVEVVRGFHPSCNKEAIRVVSNMQKWLPGMQNGKPVDVYFTIPIVFKLQN